MNFGPDRNWAKSPIFSLQVSLQQHQCRRNWLPTKSRRNTKTDLLYLRTMWMMVNIIFKYLNAPTKTDLLYWGGWCWWRISNSNIARNNENWFVSPSNVNVCQVCNSAHNLFLKQYFTIFICQSIHTSLDIFFISGNMMIMMMMVMVMNKENWSVSLVMISCQNFSPESPSGKIRVIIA